MTTRYAPSTGNFYPPDIEYGVNLPADVIDITQEDYDAAMNRPEGFSFHFINGQLVLAPPATIPFSAQSASYMAEVRVTREAMLNRLAGIGMAALVNGNTAGATEVATMRQALLDITEAPGVLAALQSEDLLALRGAVKATYKAIASAAPEWLRNAFNGVDA